MPKLLPCTEQLDTILENKNNTRTRCLSLRFSMMRETNKVLLLTLFSSPLVGSINKNSEHSAILSYWFRQKKSFSFSQFEFSLYSIYYYVYFFAIEYFHFIFEKATFIFLWWTNQIRFFFFAFFSKQHFFMCSSVPNDAYWG